MRNRVSLPVQPPTDEHAVLLWQACAYAEELVDAARSGQRLTPEYDAMLGFVHYRLLPHLDAEERELLRARLGDEHMLRLLVADHERLSADADNLELSRTRRLLTLATGALVDRPDRHVRWEESWVGDATAGADPGSPVEWGLLTGEIELDSRPARHRDRLALRP